MSAVLVLAGCEGVELPSDAGLTPSDGVDGVSDWRDVQRAEKAPPVMGGTMMVTRDGAFAVLADPVRDLVHIVDLETSSESATIEVGHDALPFRGAEDHQGLVHITLRGTGEVVAIAPHEGRIVGRTQVCPNPRGIAFEPKQDVLIVACAGGVVAKLQPRGGVVQRRYVQPDLRDVLVDRGQLLVTRFRAAEVLAVDLDAEGSGWTLAGAPQSLVVEDFQREPTTAWRTVLRPEGGWLMLHQAANTTPLPAFDMTEEGIDGQGLGSVSQSVGGWGGPSPLPCGGVTHPTVSATSPDGRMETMGLFRTVALAVDVAVSPDGAFAVIASPSQHDVHASGSTSLFRVPLGSLPNSAKGECRDPDPLPVTDDIVAVAYDADGGILAQARDQPLLYRVRAGVVEEIELAGEAAFDTGHDLFHLDAGSGISCASCHPEGGDDGRTWFFNGTGARRTQSLNIGLRGTLPLHWSGDMVDMDVLATAVRERGMGGLAQAPERVAALQDWLFSMAPPNPIRAADDSQAQRGAALFGSFGCATCHAGPNFTSNAFTVIGPEPLQIPNLHGVALRAPFMHDGRSKTLEDAVIDMLPISPGAPTATDVSPEDLTTIVAYLETL